MYNRTKVEAFSEHELIAVHVRHFGKDKYIQNQDHLASWHKYPTEWNPEKFIADATLIGEAVAAYIKKVLSRNEYPEKNYRACQGIINYKKRVGETRLINACKRADSFNVYNFGIIERILKSKADFIPLEDELKPSGADNSMPLHDNIRGEDYYKKREDLFITGSTGTGKSFLASALGQQACLLGYKVLYTNTAKLMSHLKMAKADGAHLKELSKIEKQDALILDDFGVQPFDTGSRALLLDIIEDRHGKRSTIITAQVPVKKWHEVIGEKTLADAILDRIVHQSIRIELYGESLRKKQKTNAETMESHL